MIIRFLIVDPKPDPRRSSDILVYQVPERSREMELLQELCDQAGIEWDVVTFPKRSKS